MTVPFVGFAPVRNVIMPRLKLSSDPDKPAPMSVAYKPVSCESMLRNVKIQAAYIIAFPPDPESALYNVWAFVFRVYSGENRIIQVALKDLPKTDGQSETSDTFVECSYGPSQGINGRFIGMSKTFRIGFRQGTTVGDFLDELVDRKLNKYQLINGRGKRHWVSRVLKDATSFFYHRDETVAARTYLHQGWEHEFPIRPGDYMELRKGKWLDQNPWKITSP